MNDDYERKEQRKQSALKVLGPLGFVDSGESEFPSNIFHPAIGETFDVSKTDPMEFVSLVFARGKERGEDAAKARIRVALGL